MSSSITITELREYLTKKGYNTEGATIEEIIAMYRDDERSRVLAKREKRGRLNVIWKTFITIW